MIQKEEHDTKVQDQIETDWSLWMIMGGLLYYLGYWGYYKRYSPWAHGRKTYQPTRIS